MLLDLPNTHADALCQYAYVEAAFRHAPDEYTEYARTGAAPDDTATSHVTWVQSGRGVLEPTARL